MDKTSHSDPSAKRLRVNGVVFSHFNTRDQWFTVYFTVALKCGYPVVQALYHRDRSFDEIFKELDPEKLYRDQNGNLIRGRENEAETRWWKRLQELLTPKLIHKFGKESSFSNPLHWFGCQNPSACQSTRVDFIHYPIRRCFGPNDEQVLWFMSCTRCSGSGRFKKCLSFESQERQNNRLTNNGLIQKDLEKSEFMFDGKIGENRLMRFYVKPYWTQICYTEEYSWMRYKWIGLWKVMDFKTSCLMLKCPPMADSNY